MSTPKFPLVHFREVVFRQFTHPSQECTLDTDWGVGWGRKEGVCPGGHDPSPAPEKCHSQSSTQAARLAPSFQLPPIPIHAPKFLPPGVLYTYCSLRLGSTLSPPRALISQPPLRPMPNTISSQKSFCCYHPHLPPASYQSLCQFSH